MSTGIGDGSGDGIYRPPTSDVDQVLARDPSEGGSVESALRGDFELDIGDALRRGWALVSGSKGGIWLGLLSTVIISQVIQTAGGVILGAAGLGLDPAQMGDDPDVTGIVGAFSGAMAVGLLSNFVCAPITLGTYMFAIRRTAGDETVTATSVFDYFAHIVPIFLLGLLQGLLIGVGLLLFILPGVYLAVAYIFAMPLMVDRGLGVWEALEVSRQVISKVWFSMFFFVLACGLIILLGAITLGIGWIWLIPLVSMATAVIYYDVFGWAGTRS